MGIHALQVSESSRYSPAGTYFNLASWNSYCFTDLLTLARQIVSVTLLSLDFHGICPEREGCLRKALPGYFLFSAIAFGNVLRTFPGAFLLTFVSKLRLSVCMFV